MTNWELLRSIAISLWIGGALVFIIGFIYLVRKITAVLSTFAKFVELTEKELIPALKEFGGLVDVIERGINEIQGVINFIRGMRDVAKEVANPTFKKVTNFMNSLKEGLQSLRGANEKKGG